MIDREEKLKAAREKLKLYKKQRQQNSNNGDGPAAAAAAADPAEPVLQAPEPVRTPTVDHREGLLLMSQEPSPLQLPLFTMFAPEAEADLLGATWPSPTAGSGEVGGSLASSDLKEYEARALERSATSSNQACARNGDNGGGNIPVDSGSANGGHSLHRRHQSLSEQIAGVLSSRPSGWQQDEAERTLAGGVQDVLFQRHHQQEQPHGEQDAKGDPWFRDQLERVEREKRDLETKVQQQASSIIHFEAYCKSLTKKLEAAQETLELDRAEFDRKLLAETECLNLKLQSHSDSIQILVAEKSALESSVDKLRAEHLSSEESIKALEAKNKDLAKVRNEEEKLAQNASSVDRTVIEALKRDAQGLTRTNEDLRHENEELQSKLRAANKEVLGLSNKLAAASSKLELAELNLDQLRAASGQTEEPLSSRNDLQTELENALKSKEAEIRRLLAENGEHVRRVEELTAYIQQATLDREQIIGQYTSYSQQLTGQIESLTQTLNELKVENHNLTCREADLVGHVQRLEGQLQPFRSKPVKDENQVQVEEECGRLRVQLEEVQAERAALQADLGQKNRTLAELGLQLENSRQAVSDLETKLEMERAIDARDAIRANQDFMAACESDKVAASRAVQQNRVLKEQLEELELAVIQVTNNKAQLADELDSLKRREDKWTKVEAKLSSEVTGLREAVKERDRNIHHMKEQVRYYANFAENSIHGHLDGKPRNVEAEREQQVERLAKELQEAKEQIRCLSSHNSELTSQLEVLAERTRENSATPTHEPADSSRSGRSSDSTKRTLSDSLREDLTSKSTPASSSPTISDSSHSMLQPDPHDNPFRSKATNGLPGTLEDPNSPSQDTVGVDGEHSTDRCTEDQSAEDQVDEKQDRQRFDLQQSIKVDASADLKSASSQLMQQHVLPGRSSLGPDAAFQKLEQKVKHAMQQIVELVSEKEHLEHIVVQLQEETETIGEYITIYQYQRQQQKQNLAEKEKEMLVLAAEREVLREKLAELQLMVAKYIQSRSSTGGVGEGPSDLPSGPEAQTWLEANLGNEEATSSTKAVILDKDKVHLTYVGDRDKEALSEYRSITLPGSDNRPEEELLIISAASSAASAVPKPLQDGNQDPKSSLASESRDQVAERIMALFSEIESSKIVNHSNARGNDIATSSESGLFKPWFWENTQSSLMTV